MPQTKLVTDVDIPEFVTGYGMARVVNAILGTELPPQMFYQYLKKGRDAQDAGRDVSPNMIASVIRNDKAMVSREEVTRWLIAYAQRKNVSLPTTMETVTQGTIEDELDDTK